MDKKTILVIDYAPSNLILLNNLLCKDCRVKVANSGSRGIKLALVDDAPDLILLEVVMPELNGFEVCDVLKKTERPGTRAAASASKRLDAVAIDRMEASLIALN
jgi:putative two-component system response regulator